MNPRYTDRKSRAEMLDEMNADNVARSTAKRIAHTTLRFTRADGVDCVRYQKTNVIERKGDTLRLDSGGWRTPTTKRRIQDFCDSYYGNGRVSVYTAMKGGWKVAVDSGSGADGSRTHYTFFDGIELNMRKGTIKGGKKALRKAQAELNRKAILRKQIIKFAGRLKTEPIPAINGGDCFYCQMREVDTGEDVMPTDCALQHVKENYLHGSLVLRAIQRSGYNTQYWFHPGSVSPEVARMLKKYLITVCGL